MIKKVENNVPWAYVINDLKDIINLHDCLLKNVNFPIKTSNVNK